MTDTNTLAQISQAAPATAGAWHATFLTWSGWVVAAYHIVKRGGGLKNIFTGLWDGDPKLKPADPAPGAPSTVPQTTTQNPTHE